MIRRLLIALSLTFVSLPLVGQEASTRQVAPEALGSLNLTSGARLQVTGKYKELIDRDLRIVDCDARFLLQRPDLIKKLLDLKTLRDNITLTGTVLEASGGIAIDVENLERAPSDVEVFSLRADDLSRRGATSSQEVLALLKDMVGMFERFRDESLVPLIRKVFTESLEAHPAALAAAEVDQRLALIRSLHRLLADNAVSMQLALELEKKSPSQEAIAAFLGQLNCRRYRGEWVTLEELKLREGLVKYGKRWVTPREKHLLEALEAFVKSKGDEPILRRRTEREYQLLAEKGTVEEGMKPEEVYVALGFPERVERRLVGQREFAQWCYGDKYYYFFEGTLVVKP